jgi:branched-subunit amino acid transport protein AzlD
MTDTTVTILTIACCGVGTYLLRYLPLSRSVPKGRRHPAWNGFLQAVGPTAIAALVAVSLWGMVSTQALSPKTLAVAIGVLGTLLAHWLTRKNLVLTVLGGTLAYGVAVALLQIAG